MSTSHINWAYTAFVLGRLLIAVAVPALLGALIIRSISKRS